MVDLNNRLCYSENMREIMIDNIAIGYELRYSTKSRLSVTVGHTGRVIVCAPPHYPIRDIEDFLSKRGEWLKGVIEKSRQNREKKADLQLYTNEIYYLGKKYKLVYREDKKYNAITKDEIRIYAPRFWTEKEKHNALVELLLHKAETELKCIFYQTLEEQKNKLNPTEIDAIINNTQLNFEVKNVKTYFGEYFSRQKKIILNARLIMYPIGFIKKVIYHELAHIIELNHSDRFYAVLGHLYPDHRRWSAEAKGADYDKFARAFMEKIY